VDGCRREVFEETGYEARIDAMLGIDVGHWPRDPGTDGTVRDFQALRLVYEATITGGELTHEIDGSTTHAAWIPLSDVEKLNKVSLVDVALRLHRERPTNGKLEPTGS
jgi:8-oxo-dGTP diphosphatase